MPVCVVKLYKNNTTRNKKDTGITYHQLSHPLLEAEVGTCLNLSDCGIISSIYRAFSQPILKTVAEFTERSHCRFNGNMPKVCCPTKWDGITSNIDLNSHSNAYLLKRNFCGISEGWQLLLKGSMVQIHEFPWMTLLVYDSHTMPYQCAGTIITERYILTAARCITFELKMVRLGEHAINTKTDCEDFMGKRYCAPPIQEFGIEKIIRHQLHSVLNKYADIALIRLAGFIDFTQVNVKPICLPLYNHLRDLNLTSEYFTVISWGFPERNSELDVLLTIPVKVIGNKKCKKRIKNRNKRQAINNSKFCAIPSGNDSRSGDSGSPLMHYDNELRYVQYGFVSDCAEGYTVYTRVTKYVKWILDSLEP